MGDYTEMKNKHREEMNSFPIKFAFTEEQFAKSMVELGLLPTDMDKVYSLGNTGGIIRKTDSKALNDMLTRHENEFRENIANDKTGDGFIYDMFHYELGNHEYILTGSVSDTLEALGLEEQEVNDNPALMNGLRLAHNNQVETQENNEEMER